MSRSPIGTMLDRVEWKCVRCGAPRGTCDCWQECKCGHSFSTGEECRNPIHVYEAVGGDIAAKVLDAIEGLYASAKVRRAVETGAYNAGYAWAKSFVEAEKELPQKRHGKSK